VKLLAHGCYGLAHLSLSIDLSFQPLLNFHLQSDIINQDIAQNAVKAAINTWFDSLFL